MKLLPFSDAQTTPEVRQKPFFVFESLAIAEYAGMSSPPSESPASSFSSSLIAMEETENSGKFKGN